MTAVVIDASVWIAAVDPGDPERESAERFLVTVAGKLGQVVVPAIARVEVACALRRRFGAPEWSRAVVAALFSAPFIRESTLDPLLVQEAVMHGTDAGLRGMDALYVAVAAREAAVLVTLDRELLKCGGGVTPESWIASSG
ncbi:MAG: PIN domain-containing protein [Gemmatimonadales bacterium]|nr:PIN domain-containing protein [Gemmatimonadales bacterium]MDZ4388635.1 PIN domain-containing protein [Gemmatimonadales bacterium]